MIAERGMKPPATIVVGEVVRLRDKLNWYERLPLFGKRIVVTRAREQADALSARLRALGADAIELPTIEIRPAADYGPLDRAIADLAAYDWLIFTSANGVRFFLERLDRSGADLRALRREDLRHRPGHPRRRRSPAPQGRPDGQGVRRRGPARSLRALRSGRPARPAAARRRGARPGPRGTGAARRAGGRGGGLPHGRSRRRCRAGARSIFDGRPDCVTFTSSSTVRNFVEASGAETLRGVPVATIGPVTTATARELGIEVTAQAQVFTIDGLLEAVLKVCGR